MAIAPGTPSFHCLACGAELADASGGQRGTSPAEGALSCPRCQASYPVVNGIPRFVPRDDNNSFGYQWNVHRTAQLDSHTNQSVSHDRLHAVTGWAEDLRGQTILEAGSGAGRFTEVLVNTGASVYSFDASGAVDANKLNNGASRNLTLFQADIFKITFPAGSFDKVICLGVIQHTADRAQAFVALSNQVRPGGQLVIDVYARRLITMLHWKYLLRPITRRMRPQTLHAIIKSVVPPLIGPTKLLKAVGGKYGARLSPIAEYSHLGLPAEVNREWAILDTFDMYAPAHDHPQSIGTLRKWFADAGYDDVSVAFGPNGLVGKGRKREI